MPVFLKNATFINWQTLEFKVTNILVEEGPNGKEVSLALESCGIITNKNTVPRETRSPFVTSGLRFGTPAVTTRGMKEVEMERIGDLILRVVNNLEDERVSSEVRKEVRELTAKFPIP